jgi:signal transduction histidine kinase
LILADPRRLREVLDYLLENAISYSPQGGAIDVVMYPLPPPSPQNYQPDQVKREARSPQGTGAAGVEQTDGPPAAYDPQEQESPHMLEICVCDYGMGIPSNHLEQIFERFHRVDTRLTREVNGLGLGLTICKYLVELHGGLIWAESCPAGGSAFHLRLPIDEKEQYLASLAGASST